MDKCRAATDTTRMDNTVTQTQMFGQGKVTAFRASDGTLRWAVNGTVHSFKSLQKALTFAGKVL